MGGESPSTNAESKPIDLDKIEMAFRLIDTDNDGYIDKSEMEKLTKNLSKEQVNNIYAKCDKDGDGKMSWTEFHEMMKNHKKPN